MNQKFFIVFLFVIIKLMDFKINLVIKRKIRIIFVFIESIHIQSINRNGSECLKHICFLAPPLFSKCSERVSSAEMFPNSHADNIHLWLKVISLIEWHDMVLWRKIHKSLNDNSEHICISYGSQQHTIRTFELHLSLLEDMDEPVLGNIV